MPAVATRSSMFATRITPNCLQTASKILSSPASEPVCAAAALAEASEAPALNNTIGLPASRARRATSRNCLVSVTCSR